MAEDADVLRQTPEQYRERANVARQQAAAMKSRLRQQELLDIARQYEDLADIADESEPPRFA
jgi:hypothetical protein